MQRKHNRPHDHLHAQQGHETPPNEPDEVELGRAESAFAEHESDKPHAPENASGRHGNPHVHRHARIHDDSADVVHLLFGSLEDLLADLAGNGEPEGNIVRVERLVRSRSHTAGGTATLGIAVTARRVDEILSVWVIVARLALDPWGHPLSAAEARAAADRHRQAQQMLAAFVADAGFEVRGGLYLLSEGCYGLNASAAALASRPDTSRTTGTGDAEAGTERTGGEEHA